MKSENIFKKFINFIRNIFNKRSSQKQIGEPIEESENEVSENLMDAQNKEKENFFELYNLVKTGKVELSSLSNEQMIKFNSIIKEEINLKKQKIVKQKDRIKNLNANINNLKVEKERLENKF